MASFRFRRRSGPEWLKLAGRRLAASNVTLVFGGDDARALLRSPNAEAVTIADESGATIVFRDPAPRLSAVLEELAHVLQAKRRSFEELDLREMLCRREVEAKECLVEKRERLGIPDDEHADTYMQLGRQRSMLAELRRRWS